MACHNILALVAVLAVSELHLNDAFRRAVVLDENLITAVRVNETDDKHREMVHGVREGVAQYGEITTVHKTPPALNSSGRTGFLDYLLYFHDNLVAFWAAALSAYFIVVALVVSSAISMFGESKDMKDNMSDEQRAVVDSTVLLETNSSESDSEPEDATMSIRCQPTFSPTRSTMSIKMSAKSMRDKKLRRAFKAHWLRDSSDEQLFRSARFLFYLALGALARHLLKRVVHPSDYSQSGVGVFELSVLILAVVWASVCVCYPRNVYYWPLFFFLCLLTLSQGLPPFSWSCQEIKAHHAHHQLMRTDDWYTTQALDAMDCSLQGISRQHVFMAAILMLPWVVPRVKMLLRFGWAWIAIYVIWSFFYMSTMEPSILSLQEHFARTAIFCVAMGVACFKKFSLEKSQQNQYVDHLRQRHAAQKMFDYLAYMVPEHVIVPMIKSPGESIAEQVDQVSILFIVISDFDHIVQKLPAGDLLKFLDETFSQFDKVCEEQGVTKIETVGEEYVACVGVVPSDIELCKEKGHGEILKRLFQAADKILQMQSSKAKFKMGMHTGPVVAGVIGRKLPRYRLFGDTINTAARMMQRSETGKLQFGQETYQELPASVKATPRGEIEMKGKGLVQTFLFDSADPDKCATKKNSATPEKPICQMAFADAEIVAHADEDSMIIGEAEELVKSFSRREMDDHTDSISNVSALQRRSRRDVEEVMRTTNSTAVTQSACTLRSRIAQLSFRKDFTPEMEQAWRLHFHENKVCKKFDIRLARYMFSFAFLTLLEVGYMLHQRTNHHRAWSNSHSKIDDAHVAHPDRLAAFIALRMVPILILLFWRFVLYGSKWLKENPFQVQSCILFTACVIAVIHFFSYECLTGAHAKTISGVRDSNFSAPFDQVFTLNYVLFFYVSTGQQNLLFRHSLFFLVLALILMIVSNFHSTHCVVVNKPTDPGVPWVSWGRCEHVGLFFPFFAQVVFLAITGTNCVLAHEEEQASRTRWRALDQMQRTRHKIEDILNSLMPPLVVEQLRKSPGNALTASHIYQHATIAQSDLCGFTKLASTRSPSEVVRFMSELFGSFDALTDKFDIYKVETVGDAYIAGMAERPLTDKNSPVAVILFGLAMVDAVELWAEKMKVKVKCRVGVHHGDCIGGILGHDMQRYHLFGNLMTGLEVLESTAPEAKVQVSQKCKEAVETEMQEQGLSTSGFSFDVRSAGQLTTSKGEVHSFDEVGGRTFVIVPDTEW